MRMSNMIKTIGTSKNAHDSRRPRFNRTKRTKATNRLSAHSRRRLGWLLARRRF